MKTLCKNLAIQPKLIQICFSGFNWFMELSNDISVLKYLVMAFLAKVKALESDNAALRAESAELRSRLNLNSQNSHKPPFQIVPFSNNQSERDIRCLKTKQKVATNFQTLQGAQRYARIQSFTSTLRKHSMNVFQNLINAFDRKPVIFQTA